MVIPDGKNGDPESGDDGDDRDKSPGDPFDRRFFRFGDSVFQPCFRPFEVGAAGGFAVDLRVGGARDLVRMRARGFRRRSFLCWLRARPLRQFYHRARVCVAFA